MQMPRSLSATRRSLLKGTGGLLASTLLSGRAIADTSPVMARLSSYMAAAATRTIPEAAMEAAKHHTLDTFAAMISGVELPPGQSALKFARASTSQSGCTVAGTKLLCGPMDAALANGMLAHSDETDDSHAPSHSHPGCSVVAAALAAGELYGGDGARFLRAVALGYDIGPRVTMTLGGLSYQMKTFRSTHSIASDFGAAAAAGCMANLNAQQMRWLLDYASQQASGITAWQRDTDHIEKSLVFGGFPARNGVSAAVLVQLGGTGVDDVFSGAGNFLQALAPGTDAASLVDKLGERYEVTRTNIKKWTVGSPIQAVLDAMENLRKRRPFEAAQVKKLVARLATSEAATVNNREMPDICLQHMAAVMLLDKTASFAAAHDRPRMKDPAILRERAKVELIGDEELEKLYPRREAIVELTLTDGTVLKERVEAVRGTAENPMTRQEVIAKSRELMTPFLGAAQTTKLIDTIFNLEKVPDIRGLRPLLQR